MQAATATMPNDKAANDQILRHIEAIEKVLYARHVCVHVCVPYTPYPKCIPYSFFPQKANAEDGGYSELVWRTVDRARDAIKK